MKRSLWTARPYIKATILSAQLILIALIVSCNSASSLPIKTITITGNDVISSKVPPTEGMTTSIENVNSTPTQSPARTKTPTNTVPAPTNTFLPCPPYPLDYDLPDPDIPENYIGRHYDLHNLPQGIEHLGGSIIRDKSSAHELAISRFAWQQDRRLYWLEKLVCQDKKQAYFEIVDAIATPALSGEETEATTCFQDDIVVNTIVALGRYDKSAPLVTINESTGWLYTQIIFAFRIDFTFEEFILLEPESLVCLQDQGR